MPDQTSKCKCSDCQCREPSSFRALDDIGPDVVSASGGFSGCWISDFDVSEQASTFSGFELQREEDYDPTYVFEAKLISLAQDLRRLQEAELVLVGREDENAAEWVNASMADVETEILHTVLLWVEAASE